MLYRKNHLSLILSLCFLTSFAACYAAEAPTEQQLPPPEKYADCSDTVKYVSGHRHFTFGPWITSNPPNIQKRVELFSTKSWLEKVIGVSSDPKCRSNMLPDLFHHSLIGMTREDIHNLLGTPDERKLKETGSNIDGYITYSGFCSREGESWLEFLYKNDKVASYRTMEYKTLHYGDLSIRN